MDENLQIVSDSAKELAIAFATVKLQNAIANHSIGYNNLPPANAELQYFATMFIIAFRDYHEKEWLRSIPPDVEDNLIQF